MAGSFYRKPTIAYGMMSKRRTTIASAAVLSLLLLGLMPVFAQTSQSTLTEKAVAIIQVAQAARSYAKQLVGIAQQHQVNTTRAESLITQGDPLLSQAQSEVSTNATLAIKDALGAMSDYRAAVQSVQSALASSFQSSTADQVEYLKYAIQRAENRTAQLQTVLTKLCSATNAPTSTCSDGKSNLSAATSDLAQASSLLRSNDANITSIVGLVKDAMQHMSAVYADINQLANAYRAQVAVYYIQNLLEKQLSKLRDVVGNLSSSAAQQYQPQLDQAQSLLTSAIQAFQSGNFDLGVNDAQQAMQLMQQVAHEVRGSVFAQYIQTVIEPKLTQLQQMAQNANLSPSISQQVQSQLAQAKSLLDAAVQSFSSGNFSAGQQQAEQAVQLMQQALQEIQSGT